MAKERDFVVQMRLFDSVPFKPAYRLMQVRLYEPATDIDRVHNIALTSKSDAIKKAIIIVAEYLASEFENETDLKKYLERVKETEDDNATG